ncbi:MAG TPA: kelch repeat-containing protein [Terriglobia bacterium]|nr:kelch repeat-containing protein [Terriglobia bacterium]
MKKGKKLAAVMLAAISWTVCCAPTGFAQWVPSGPGPRDQHSAVFDAATNQMIVFGGTDLGTINYNDVWVALNVIGSCSPACSLQWTFEASTGLAPAARSGHSAVYDSTNSRMIVFGGAEGFPSPCTNDVWVLENANGVGGTPGWIELSPGGTLPPARTGQAAVYDPVRNVMIVFGGSDCNGGYLSDVWVLSNANGLGSTPTWIQLTPVGSSPPARAYASAAFSSSSHKLVIYGGTDGDELADVWALSGIDPVRKTCSWSHELPSGTAPAGRYGAASGYDSTNDRMIINGGFSAQGILADTWVLQKATGAGGSPSWSTLSAANSGSQVYFHSGVYDATHNEFVVFAGISERAPSPQVADDHIFVLTDANGQ